MLRQLNMFILTGIALVCLGFAGFLTHSGFLTEAGIKPVLSTSWIYLGTGILMLVNGVLSWKQTPVKPVDKKSATKS